MDPKTSSLVASVLSRCKNLSDADRRLKDLVSSRATRWGLWDGWDGRPRCTAGLALEPVPQDVEKEYVYGCSMGEAMAVNGKI